MIIEYTLLPPYLILKNERVLSLKIEKIVLAQFH